MMQNIYIVILVGLNCLHSTLTDQRKLYDIRFTEPFNTNRQEIAELHNAETLNPELVVKGEILNRYGLADGKFLIEMLTYVADKNGYRFKYELVQYQKTEQIHISALALKIAAG